MIRVADPLDFVGFKLPSGVVFHLFQANYATGKRG